jgi:hypothetical protein
MQAFLVVVPSPYTQTNLRVQDGQKCFPIQKLVPEPGMETLGKPVLPWLTWFYISRVNAAPMA